MCMSSIYHSCSQSLQLILTEAARKARSLAEAAFFQPSIMSLLYFPAEHQLAIYTVSALMLMLLISFKKRLSPDVV